MNGKSLTEAIIRKKKKTSNFNLKISLAGLGESKEPYLLIIQSTASKCTRLTIYPTSKKKILKISITGSEISESSIEELSSILKDFKLIHTSGLLIKDKELNYECYLNLSLSDLKTKNLKSSLNNIRNRFKEIKIEEIGLRKSKTNKL